MLDDPVPALFGGWGGGGGGGLKISTSKEYSDSNSLF
jgi:hypothetical protein